MKAKIHNKQLQHYKGNWATFEIMKTLNKNRRIYRRQIGSADQSDREQGPGKKGNSDEKGNDEGGDANGNGNRNRNADGEGEGKENANDNWYVKEEGNVNDDWYVKEEGNADEWYAEV